MRRIVLVAAPSLLAVVFAADLEWKWDASNRIEPVPATASAAIVSVLPNTVSTVNGETADTFVYDWLDSAGFNFDGCQPGLYMIFR